MSNIKQNITPLDKNGKRHGEWLYYYNNGKLQYRENWVHGVRHGFCEIYYSDGQVMERGNYHMGRRIGFWGQNVYFLRLI